MTKIIVNEAGMNQEASDIMQQMRKIEAVKEGIKSVRARLNSDISMKSGINRRLRQAYEACGEYVSVSGEMSNVIREAVELYRKCENGIIGQCGQIGAEEGIIRPEWSELLDFINNPLHGTIFHRFSVGIDMVGELDYGSAILIASSKSLDILYNMLCGKDYEVEIIKKSLGEILKNMEERTSAATIPDEVKLIVKTIKEGGKLIPKLAKKYGIIINGLGDVSDLIKGGNEGVEYLEYVLTDYCESIETLEILRQTGIDNPKTQAAVDSLIEMYTDKFLGSAIMGKEYVIEKIGSEVAENVVDFATGGLYKCVELGKDVVFEFSGLNDRVEAMETIMANAFLEKDISQGYFAAMENLSSGNITETSVAEAQRMFDMYKATKISQYESALELVESAPRKYDDFSAAEIRSDLELLKSLEMNVESILKVNSKRFGTVGEMGGK